MRNFKTFLWIFIIFLIQTVIMSRIHAFGAVVSIAMAYIICVMMLENEFRRAVCICVICAGVMGALCGREFVLTTLFYVYAPMIVFAMRKKPVYVGNFPKAVFWTFVASGLFEVIYVTVINMSFDVNVLLHDALPTAVINGICVLAVYPALKLTMYREEKKKKLLIA